mmetsp:Transcript_22373/g.21558  ORF Transcript_22373/g.21558 Transcript_22373/m.21558 type:complete len:123 (+) Transcript_22373:24-392(+)|eukprot:CAMPEP_0170545540 /NCGR_PEP_ID=MMETSP0211-20121228/3935_1 /TAXON_ID=311385 /ORGANISM="Pseudokeronopsis sp., Strain OXSARD2" /LENGTH=122 /DNA_ID=CAMNT_0010849513 /DNA_START=15 /DNA_END=383 /DNA_ORIENTATION=+
MKSGNKVDKFEFKFKQEITFEKRCLESAKIVEKYGERIPVVIEKSDSEENLPDLEQTKYLIPTDFSFQQFLQIIRERLKLDKNTALFIFFGDNKLKQSSKNIKQIYEECKDEDGFLYCKYTS